jgi:hypothetical protein
MRLWLEGDWWCHGRRSSSEPCGFLGGVSIPAIGYSIPYLEGSHNPDMMPEVSPWFKPFERCCMVILFVGGRGKTREGAE